MKFQVSALGSTPNWSEEIEAIVDTGATYTKVPRKLMERLGIRAQTTRKVRLGDARSVDRDAAPVMILLQGQVGVSMVTFGEEGEESLLGAVTLEEFGYSIDPVSKRLVPAELYEL